MTHKIEITIGSDGRGTVSVDGRPFIASSIAFSATAGEAPRVVLTAPASEVRFAGEAELHIIEDGKGEGPAT